VARGDYSVQVELSGKNDEVDSLAMGLNMMVDDIRTKEEALRGSQEKWRSLTWNTDDTIEIVDKNNVIRYINRTIPPETPKDVVGKTIYEYVSKEHHDVMRESLERVYKTAKPDSYEVTLDMSRINPEIGTLWFRTKVVPITTNEEVSAVIMIATDITERKRAEELIQQQNRFLTDIFESLTHPFYVVDANDYTIKMANRAAKLGDLSKASTCYALTHKRDKPCAGVHVCPLEEVKKTGKPVVVEHIHYDKDGNPRNIEVHGYPIIDTKGNVIRMIEYGLDITERKQMESELQ